MKTPFLLTAAAVLTLASAAPAVAQAAPASDPPPSTPGSTLTQDVVSVGSWLHAGDVAYAGEKMMFQAQANDPAQETGRRTCGPRRTPRPPSRTRRGRPTASRSRSRRSVRGR